jgi:hypothetical protein
MLTIELAGGPKVVFEDHHEDAFGAAVLAAVLGGDVPRMGDKIVSLSLYTQDKPTISEPKQSSLLTKRETAIRRGPDTSDGPPAHGARSQLARDVAVEVLSDGDWHPKTELNKRWRAAGLELSLAVRALAGHVEKRKAADGSSEWRLDPGSELWDATIDYDVAAHVNVVGNGAGGAVGGS